MTSILAIVTEAMKARIAADANATEAKNGKGTAFLNSSTAIAKAFDRANVVDESVFKQAYAVVCPGKDLAAPQLSEYMVIARAGQSGHFATAVKACEDYATACEAQEVAAGMLSRNLLNLLRDHVDTSRGFPLTPEGIAKGKEVRSSDPVKMLKALERAAKAFEDVNVALDVSAQAAQVKAAFPDAFKAKGKKTQGTGKKTPVLTVVPTTAPAPQPVVRVEPASAPVAVDNSMDIAKLIAEAVGQQMAAFMSAQNTKSNKRK